MRTAIITLASFLATSSVSADTVRAKVEDVYTTVYDPVARTKQECTLIDVPIYGTVQGNGASGGDVLGGMIIGGLLGKGATGKDDGAAIGAILGGIVAADQGNQNRQVITGYKKERSCQDVTYYDNVSKRVYDYSTITWVENGKTYSYEFIK
jgi:uncharacterized protein YcfJ